MAALPSDDDDAAWAWLREHRVHDDAWRLMQALLERPALRKDAACVEHPELNWFPDPGESRLTDLRAICRKCLVKAEYLEYGVENHVQGVLGGASERERTQLRRLRAQRRERR
jgi:hypothetical protein